MKAAIFPWHGTPRPRVNEAFVRVGRSGLFFAGLAAISVMCCAARVKAGVIAEDSFNDLAGGGGSLHGKNGGTGWAGGWVTNSLGNTAIIADATGVELTFAPAGGELIDGGVEAVDVFGTVNQPVANRQLATAPSGTFYVAYLFRLIAGSWTDSDTFSIHLANNGGNASTMNFGLRGDNNANLNHFMVRTGTGAPLAGDSFGGIVTLNTTYLLIARVSKPSGSGTYDQIDMWLNPGVISSNAPNATLNLATGTGLASVSHVILRPAALEAGDTLRLDELIVASAWTDIIVPVSVVPTVNSFSLMYPGNGGPVPGYDPLTNGAVFNLFVTDFRPQHQYPQRGQRRTQRSARQRLAPYRLLVADRPILRVLANTGLPPPL